MDNNTKMIADFLGIDGSLVESVELSDEGGRAAIRLKLKNRRPSCPHCGCGGAFYEGFRKRAVADALFHGRKTTVTLLRRRYTCMNPLCGKGFYEPDPITLGSARVTRRMALEVLGALSDYSATFESVARRFGLSNTAVLDIFDRYYNPRRGRLPKFLCLDECYLKGNFDKPYALVLMDWEEGKVVDVLKGRNKPSVSSYLFSIPPAERESVEVVSIDMWEPYLDLAKSYLKNATVVVDSFHVMENLARAVDGVRKRVASGWPKDSDQHRYLKKYGWTLFKMGLDPYERKSKDKVTKAYLNSWDAQQRILSISPDLRTAHKAYVHYKYFNSKRHSKGDAERTIEDFCSNEEFKAIPELSEFLGTLERWKEYIAASFDEYVSKRRVSNGPIEGFNSLFKKLLRVTNGMKNFARFRARLLLCNSKKIILSNTPSKRKGKGKKRGKYNKEKPAKT